MIEDLSEDTILDELDQVTTAPEIVSLPGKTQLGTKPNLLNGILGIDDSMGDNYVEKTIDADGHELRKEVHKGNGWTSVQVTGDLSAM